MGLFDRFKQPKVLVLARSSSASWPEKLYAFQKLDALFTATQKSLARAQNDIEKALHPFHSLKADVPERAAHITQQHAKVLSEEVQKLLELKLGNPLDDPDIIASLIEQVDSHKETIQKNVSALSEYYEKELQELTLKTQDLEDLLIETGSAFEKAYFEQIVAIKELLQDLETEQAKVESYEKTRDKYKVLREENAQRQEKHEDKIASELVRVREDKAKKSLASIKTLESNARDIKRFYERLVFDIKHYLLKNNIKMSEKTKSLFSELKRDAQGIVKNSSELQKEFTALNSSLQDLPTDDAQHITRNLEEAMHRIGIDAKTLEEQTSKLLELKKDVMQDIAALNIYEQEQFLLRAQKEAGEIEEKIDFITQALTHARVDEITENIEDLLAHFSVLVREED